MKLPAAVASTFGLLAVGETYLPGGNPMISTMRPTLLSASQTRSGFAAMFHR
jgi:hypothetical protein